MIEFPAYPVETYMQLSIAELEQRFKNFEPLVRIYKKDHDILRRALDDPEWGRTKLAEYQERLDEYKKDMQNIVIAIEIKSGGRK